MKMVDYLTEVEFAVGRLIDAVWHEQKELQRMRERIDELTAATQRGYTEAESLAGNEFDDELLATASYSATYSGVDQARLNAESVYAVFVTRGFFGGRPFWGNAPDRQARDLVYPSGPRSGWSASQDSVPGNSHLAGAESSDALGRWA